MLRQNSLGAGHPSCAEEFAAGSESQPQQSLSANATDCLPRRVGAEIPEGTFFEVGTRNLHRESTQLYDPGGCRRLVKVQAKCGIL